VRDAVGGVQSLLVLGGTSEIGLATARNLTRGRTRRIVLAARDPSAAEGAADELRGLGTEVEVVPFDARDFSSHAPLVDRVFEGPGDIDCALVAFGVLGDQEHLARDGIAAERMREQGHGVIVVLSSVAGERARKSNFVYGSSKAGLDAFAQGLGDRLHGSGVHVMVVRPGFVRTKMTAGLDDVPLSTGPDAVAEAIADGLRRNAHTVWVPTPLRFVMSALRHLPRPLFRRLNV